MAIKLKWYNGNAAVLSGLKAGVIEEEK